MAPMRSIHTAVLLLATAEPPGSAAALPDQTGSMYQRAPLNGLSKRGPTLVLEELELILEELLTLEELTTEELERMLEELATDELDLEEETGAIDELLLTLDELTTLELATLEELLLFPLAA